MNSEYQEEQWTEVVKPQTGWLDLNLKEVWRYRDLLLLLVRRDFVATYKQTILGPLWFFLQPVLTTIIFIIVFFHIAGISTDGVSPVLFYLAGITLWNYFSECLNKIATVFRDNAAILSKVYFPRLIIPLSVIVSNLIKLGIQFFLFLCVWCFFLGQEGEGRIQPNRYALLLPLLIFLMAVLALGFGLLFSAVTVKYRDLVFLLTFIVQLAMYATPIIYPLSKVSNGYQWFIKLNPLTAIIESFRYGFLGVGSHSWIELCYSGLFAITILAIGMIAFNAIQKSFVDII